MWIETQPSVQSSFQKLNFTIAVKKTLKIRCYIFEIMSNFTVFL